MTQTTNIGLKKIDGSENWRQIFDYHNDSADKTDSAVSAVQDGIAIVANGNTHASVAEGQFVYVRNHSTLAEGLYKAASAIGTNGELTTSNLTADSSGGLNDLQEQITALNSNFTSSYDSLTLNSGITGTLRILRMGKLRSIYGDAKPSSSGAEIVLCTLTATDRPPIKLKTSYSGYGVNATGEVSVDANGRIIMSANSAPANSLKFCITYAVE